VPDVASAVGSRFVVHQFELVHQISGAETPAFRDGVSAVSFLCAILYALLTAYRRACGNRRLWSGADTQGSNERVRRSQRASSCLVRSVQPRNPLP
jgi:hypothetical protein